MYRSNGDMASPRLFVLLALSLIATCNAGPLPNVTSVDIGLKEGGCAVGDVVYLSGDEFPGASACERCRCAGGAVSCARARCEPRPGCKALHRPDHCCPTYQCECEQEGRVYGNGEKLVDPADPCRVCYCQGGEVVCRRIACFLRDDCTPRLVPGRCCPEYDNCPLRGVTTVPGVTPSISTIEEISSSLAPSPPRENMKQEITIKEITPVSEIPVIPEVKIKEILPTPGIEVPDYSSSKSPLIVREATTERVVTNNVDFRTEKPVIIEVQPSSTSSQPDLPSEIPTTPTKSSDNVETKISNDFPPSKFSLSPQDSINSDLHPSIMTSIATMGVPSITPDIVPAMATTKTPVVEEEDMSLFDHNPAFPPLPDDLSVLSNHGDELLPEQTDADHILIHEATSEAFEPPIEPVTRTSVPVATVFTSVDIITENSKAIPETTPAVVNIATETSTYLNTENYLSTAKTANPTNVPGTLDDINNSRLETTLNTDATKVKNSPMLNLRSAIPTELLDVPSSVPEEINGDLDDVTDSSPTSSEIMSTVSFVSTENVGKEIEKSTVNPELLEDMKLTRTTAPLATVEADVSTNGLSQTTEYLPSTKISLEQTSSLETKSSSIVTEITAQTEFSSLPIETSDQKPKENFENIEKEILLESTINPSPADFTPPRVSTPTETEIIAVSRSAPSSTDNQFSENVETTEFVITFGSSESATDAVELIKISAEPEKSAAIIQPDNGKKNSVLTDLINLVGDVAAISDHTEGPDSAHRSPVPATSLAPPAMAAGTGISESEELIPVNAGYKSKNNNWNLNSITEAPIKSKSSPPGSKQKIVEIEDEEAESITDSPPPNDKVEPTTRRPIIDNVSDDTQQNNRTEKKDIEIITKSYVPTISRRPTKVVMKKNNELPVSAESSAETEARATTASEATTAPPADTTTTSAPADTKTTSAPADTTTTSAPADTTTTTAPAAADTTTVSPELSSTTMH